MASSPRHQKSDDDAEQPSRAGRAVVAVLVASLLVAAAGIAGGVVTSSASLVAVGLAAAATSLSQALLLRGRRRAARATEAEHPLGYGRDRYFWPFVVTLALLLAAAAGAIALGLDRVDQPEALDRPEGALGGLGVALVLVVLALRYAIGVADDERDEVAWRRWLRRSTRPELPVALVEATVAVVALVAAAGGIALTAYAEEPTGDGWGAVAVGAALALGALVVVSLMRSLLIGSPATARQVEGIRAAIEFDPDVVGIAHLRTDHLGPDELLVGAKVEFLADLSVPELAATIDRIERSIRTGIPAARIIYLEPDVADGERAAAFVAEHEGHIDLDDPRYRDVAGTDASADAADDADIWS